GGSVTIPALGAAADHDAEATHAPLRVNGVCRHVNCALAGAGPGRGFVSAVKILAVSVVARRGHSAPVAATSWKVAQNAPGQRSRSHAPRRVLTWFQLQPARGSR